MMQVVVSDGHTVVCNNKYNGPGSMIEMDEATGLDFFQRGFVRLPVIQLPPDPFAASLPPDVVAKRTATARAVAEVARLAALGLAPAGLVAEAERLAGLGLVPTQMVAEAERLAGLGLTPKAGNTSQHGI